MFQEHWKLESESEIYHLYNAVHTREFAHCRPRPPRARHPAAGKRLHGNAVTVRFLVHVLRSAAPRSAVCSFQQRHRVATRRLETSHANQTVTTTSLRVHDQSNYGGWMDLF